MSRQQRPADKDGAKRSRPGGKLNGDRTPGRSTFDTLHGGVRGPTADGRHDLLGCDALEDAAEESEREGLLAMAAGWSA